MKSNNKLLYVHWLSNHPPALLKNIPLNINKRLTNISSSEQVFNEASAPYQQALEEGGYDYKLKFDPQAKRATRKSKARKRKITWYNPPWDSNVKTNPGRKFLLIVDKCFPKNHPLNKIFNRHTLKLSYSCMPNMKAVISSHNKNMLAQDSATAAQTQLCMCNCRNKPECPLQGSCMQENVVYQATVDTETKWKTTSDLLRISKNGIETIRHLSGTKTREMRPSYRSSSGTSKTKRSRFMLSGES